MLLDQTIRDLKACHIESGRDSELQVDPSVSAVWLRCSQKRNERKTSSELTSLGMGACLFCAAELLALLSFAHLPALLSCQLDMSVCHLRPPSQSAILRPADWHAETTVAMPVSPRWSSSFLSATANTLQILLFTNKHTNATQKGWPNGASASGGGRT